jgi:hypothetical protein
MYKKLTLENTSPYLLFRNDSAKLDEFLRKCKHCKNNLSDNMPANKVVCPILGVLTKSIVDNHTLRWDEKWVVLDKGWPVCLHFDLIEEALYATKRHSPSDNGKHEQGAGKTLASDPDTSAKDGR